MSDLRITTNHHERPIVEAYELTADERAEFDYVDWSAVDRGEASASFVRYRGELVDLSEFEVWDNPASPTRMGWHGVRPDSYFSGLVVRYSDDYEYVIVGRYMA